MAKVQIIPRRSFFLGDMLLNESEVAVVEEADVGHLIKTGWVDLVEGGGESKPAAGKKSGGKKAPSKVSETDGQREGETDGQREGETDGQREGEGENV